ncbi:choice-of-anchor D domain-containing protein [Flavobacterium sp. WC2430]|uniref:choice-of-anchor D domain-containing protein n=1 Tax=Flavobacterium sp. WC2430 TaxID=3234137 RepID=UPI003465452D
MNRKLLLSNNIFFTLFIILLSLSGFSQATQTYNTAGTYTFTVPAGVTSINIEAWGAGGAGGGATGNNCSAGGGSGGAYARRNTYTVTPGSNYTVIVGSGGIGSRNNGTSGGSSSLSTGGATILLAVGGNGANAIGMNNSYTIGATAVNTGNSGFTGTLNYYGGKGGDGITTNGYAGGGGGGSSAGSGSNGNAGVNQTGGAAVTAGAKGADGSIDSGDGAFGFSPGGGGAGAVALTNTDRSGGGGGSGQVIISWTCPIFTLTGTNIATPSCSNYVANINVTSTAAGLPIGTYTVTYNFSGANTASGNTATMNVTTAGTGTFTSSTLANSGSTTITIIRLATGTCNNTISASNTATVTVAATPTITSTTPNSRTGTGTVPLSATASAGTISWFSGSIGGTALATGNSYTTPSISTTTTYYIQSTNGSCTSSPRVAITATINNPEIAVSGNGINIADDSTTPSTTNFTNLGSSNVLIGLTRTYTINNLGAATLNLGSITISGANASEFVATNPPTTIAPQSSATFSITFTPTAIGFRNATLSFTNNDSDENPFNFNISGTGDNGVTPEINLQGNGNNISDGASSSTTNNNTDFGGGLIGTPIVKTFTIQNTGTGPLLLTGSPTISLTGDNAFSVTSQPTSNSIAPGASLTFQVTFNSAITGNFLAIITINNNDNDESNYDFVITAGATVVGREIDIQGNDVSIVSGDTTPSPLDQTDFGITDLTTKISIPFQVYNYGNSTLTLTSTVSISGTGASSFTATNLPNSLSAPPSTNTTSFVVTYNPAVQGIGIRNATITVTNNDNVGTPSETSYSFAIQAESKAINTITIAPGGITSNLKFWLKADSNIGKIIDGAPLSNWIEETSSSTKNAIAKLGTEPKFNHSINKNVNFNPVIYFNGANSMAGGQGFNNLDMYIVVKPNATINSQSNANDIYCGDDVINNKPSQDVTGFEMGNTSSRFLNEILAYNQASSSTYGVGELSTTKSYTGANIFNPSGNGTRMGIYNNGTLLSTTEANTGTYKNIVNSRYWLGASETFGPSYEGDILEIINYNTSNNATDRRRIETYLAIKYGITLGNNGTSLNYYNSASTNTASSIYDENAGFNYNIAGIGRDDKSALKQRQSKTENTSDDITIGLGGIYDKNTDNPNNFVNDKEFLVWGSDNGTLLAQPAVVVNISSGITPALTTDVDYITIGRTWRVKETGGNIPSCKVSIPSTLLTSTITPPGDFLMFISTTPQFNAISEYRVMRVNGSKLETDYDFDGTKYITFGYAPERTYERAIDFNGVSDYLDAGKVLDLNSSFTVSAWMKTNGSNQTILSKRNSPYTAGYDLSINVAGKVEMSWFNGTKQTITSSIIMPLKKWHNICIVYDNTTSTAKLYVDGFEDASKTLSKVPANPTQSFLIAAADGTNPTSFFNGTIDEVRVWSVPLTVNQLRYVMNQEILSNGIATNGKIIPNTISSNEISSIPWSNLSAYYPMSTYTFTNAKDISNNNYTAALRNLTTVNLQTAPLPYESLTNGLWQTPETWKNNSVQDIPYSLSIVDDTETINWNIVKMTHNITSQGNKTVLGLYVGVGTGSTLTATTTGGLQTDGTKIEVSHYLKLDGKIDLVGRSQLVQKLGSDLDVTSSGSIERDQQGQANKYNYNYWSSPVGTINNTANNTPFTVGTILKDGTNPASLAAINWVGGYDGAPTTPISLARYWIYKFDNLANDYYNWNQLFETGTLQAGKGFTLKGSGAATATQNLTFVGKPNNGTITNTVGADQLLLTGNPYPSALDANKFINDNIGSIETSTSNPAIDGALYFWEHYATNVSHNLGSYQGGYGIRNLSGGVAPSSVGVNFISGSGATSKAAPNQFIPVGQAFFINGKIGSGGNVIYKNSQRDFHKEDEIGVSQTTYKIPENQKGYEAHWTDNSNATLEKDNYKRVRLGYNYYNQNFHRQVLLAFMDEKANSEINDGYDALNIDDSPSDMYLLNKENELAIEGEGYFDTNASYPIGIRNEVAGKISFNIDSLENFDESQNVYIFDKETNTYNSIKNTMYEVELPEGTFNDRFVLHFSSMTSKTLGTTDFNLKNGIKVIVNNGVTVQSDTALIKTILVYDLLGRKIDSYKKVNAAIQLLNHLNKTNSGLILRITLDNDEVISKKIIY